jgi:diguanylate cyclase (GGDEF)-like protein
MNKLHEKSLRDGMTNLYNRRFLDNYLDKNIKDGDKFYMMMIDIDFFKQVNDTYGHDVGDEVIKYLSDVLARYIKYPNLPVRYGGEEFLAIVYNNNLDEVRQLASDIRAEFSSKVINANSETFSKTLSVGIASFPEDSQSAWETLKHADVALYNAKNSGRDKVVTFESSMYDEDMI